MRQARRTKRLMVVMEAMAKSAAVHVAAGARTAPSGIQTANATR